MRAIASFAFAITAGAFAGWAIQDASAGLDVMPDLSGFARNWQVPPPSVATPPATALDGSLGNSGAFARADHTHAARVQRTVITTGSDGTATWTFARPFVVPAGKLPPVSNMVEDTGSPVIVQVIARGMTTDGTSDTHTSVTIKAQRSRALPATLVALGPLVGYDVFGLAGVSVRVNMFAADPTQ